MLYANKMHGGDAQEGSAASSAAAAFRRRPLGWEDMRGGKVGGAEDDAN